MCNLLSESPVGTWKRSDANAPPAKGVGITSTQFRTASTAFNYQADYATNTLQSAIGLSISATIPSGGDAFSCEYWLEVNSSGNYSAGTAGFVETNSATIAAVAGDKFRLRVDTGNIIRAEYFRNNTWNPIYTFSTANANKMYMVGHSWNPYILLNPKFS